MIALNNQNANKGYGVIYKCLHSRGALLFVGLTLGACSLFFSPEERLFRAVYENRESDVSEILGGGKVKNIDELFSGMSSLHFAAINGNDQIVRMLIDYGADIDLLSSDGSTPLYFAASYGRYEVAKELINSGVSIDKPDPDFGFTPLIVALRKGHIEVAKFLTESGADACAVRVNNRNALQAARAYKQLDFIDWYHRGGFPKCQE